MKKKTSFRVDNKIVKCYTYKGYNDYYAVMMADKKLC